MLKSTQTALTAILNADPSLPAEERAAWCEMFRRGNPLAAVEAVAPAPLPRLVSAREVCRLAGVTPQTVRRYARRGILRRVIGSGMQRGRGYTFESVKNLLEGRTASAPIANADARPAIQA